MMASNTTLSVRVAQIVFEAKGVLSFELVAPDGGLLPAFTSGAHIDVYLPNGLVRQYSLINSPAERSCYRIAVLWVDDSRGGSQAAHMLIKAGDLIKISVPRNNFVLSEGKQHYLLLAGGIGITPIMCMAQTLSDAGASFELHYFGRSSEHMAFVQQLSASNFADQVYFHVSDDPVLQSERLALTINETAAAAHLYVCGPEGLINSAVAQADALGWDETRIHYERFSGAVAIGAGAEAFDLEIASTGQVLHVPADMTALDVLRESGYDVPSSCEQGVCGTCLLPVLDGIPDHHDTYLLPEEREINDQFTACCSRAKSPKLLIGI